MRRRHATLLSAALLATVIGVLAPNSPVAATGICAGALGTAGTGIPLTYPVTLVPNPGGPSVTVTVHQPVTTGFGVNFTTGACVHVPGVLKGLSATGTVSGWCGHSSGQGATFNGERFAWVSAGGVAVLTGGLTGVVNVVPDTLQNQTCNANKGQGASKFLVSPVALSAHCNITKAKVTTPLPIPNALITPVDTNGLRVNVHTGSPTYNLKLCLSGPL